MFDWFTNSKNTPDNVIEFPQRPKEPKDTYRVGVTDDGRTSLTLISADGQGSITLTMNLPATLRLIRLLEATLDQPDDAA